MGSQLPEAVLYERKDKPNGNGGWFSQRNQGLLLLLCIVLLGGHIYMTRDKLDTEREMRQQEMKAMQTQIDNLVKGQAECRSDISVERGRINSLSEKAIQR